MTLCEPNHLAATDQETELLTAVIRACSAHDSDALDRLFRAWVGLTAPVKVALIE